MTPHRHPDFLARYSNEGQKDLKTSSVGSGNVASGSTLLALVVRFGYDQGVDP